jgi:hypothetical protein
MQLFDLIRNKKVLSEGGNLSLPGGHEAQQIDLKVHNRSYIVPVLDNLINSINNLYSQQYQTPLWDPKLIKQRSFLSGSSLHFFNTDIPDEEFIAKKPKVGDIDTQVNKDYEGNLEQFLTANQNKVIGPAKLLGFQRGNEQFSSLWEFTDPPIKVQIDLEFVAFDKKGPTAWSQFSHSSSWDDLQAGIKGVFHKFLIQSFTTLTSQDFLLQKFVGRGANKTVQHVPTRDNMVSFAVSSKEGGGLRAKYAPVMDEKGKPLFIDGLPVMQPLPPAGYEQDLSAIFSTIFDTRVNSVQLKKLMPKTWSFTGLIDVMNLILDPEEKAQVLDGFINKLFAKGAQGLYKNDPDRDLAEKNAALNYMIAALKIPAPADLEALRQAYKSNYKMTTEGPLGLDRANQLNEAEVKAQFRKNMPHLRDLKPIDFLDLLDEIHDGNGNFKLQNIPLNVKVDGFGGRFGKDAEGKPFMATSNTPPRYKAGFVQYHQEKGTTDPEILSRAEKFDQLFNEMMNAIKLVDSKLGPDFLVNKQVTCEVLFLPFATETTEGKLKFVGIQYDKFPAGVELVLVPFRVVDASTGGDVPDADNVVSSLAELGGQGSVRFLSNSLVQQEGLDVTEIINPLDNIEELKQIVSDTAGKRDRASLQLRREVEEKLMPVKIALEKAIDADPNIIGKDILGQDYEGIVINSRLGPIKVTSQKQKDIITQKNAAKSAARAEQPRTGNKTAVVAIGSFVGHKGHEELFNFTIDKASEVGGDPYLFIGNAVGKDDPIPPDVKVQTWHKMYPKYAKNISTTQQGGSLMQKIKHELINPLPGKPPRYDNIIIMVGEDQQSMPIAGALMKAVNKFQGYEHVKVSLEATPRGTGMSFTKLRNILKDPNATPEQQYAVWAQGFDEAKLGKDWILHLMDISRKGMGVTQLPKKQPAPTPVAETRLLNSLVRPNRLYENEQVRQLQQLLIKKGAKITADGIMGPLTQAAMKQFGVGGTPTPTTPTPTTPTAPVAQKTLAPSKPGVEKKIAGVVSGGPGYTDVKTTDGEVQRREGTRNWRNNNPGNIRKGSYAQSKGAVGDDGAFAVFPTLEVGMDAKEDLIFGPRYINLSIQDAISKYAPPSENDTQGYIKKVNQATGTTPDTPLNKLNPEQRDLLLKTISKVEGFKVGNIKVVSNVAESTITELSSEKLGQYKKAAGAQASAADKAGNTKKADKRFSGIVKATKKQFANDEKNHVEQEHIVKVKGGYELKSKHGNKNLGKYPTKAGAEKRERQVQYFKHAGESVAVEPDPTGYQKDLLTSPKNALVIDTPGDLDWYKLGQHYPTLDKDDPHEYGQGDSDMVIVPYSKKELAGLKKNLDRLKMRYKDIGGGHEQPEIHDKVEEKMLPKSAFAGSDKNKLGPVAHAKGKQKGPVKKGQFVGGMEEGVDEGLGAKLAGLGLAGAMALGAGNAQARVTGDEDPGINRLTGKPNVTQVAPSDVKPAASAPTGFSKEYLQKAADPNRVGRYMISVEKAQELLKKIDAVNESKNKYVPVSEDVENLMGVLIENLIRK